MGCFLSEPLAQLSPKVFFDEVDMDLADQREQPVFEDPAAGDEIGWGTI